MNCDQHDHCTLQCGECRSYECQDVDHRWSPWLHRRDWEAIIRQAVDDMPDDREAYYNERAERMP